MPFKFTVQDTVAALAGVLAFVATFMTVFTVAATAVFWFVQAVGPKTDIGTSAFLGGFMLAGIAVDRACHAAVPWAVKVAYRYTTGDLES